MKSSHPIVIAGALLALAGVALFVYSIDQFESLPNHLRFALLIPLT